MTSKEILLRGLETIVDCCIYTYVAILKGFFYIAAYIRNYILSKWSKNWQDLVQTEIINHDIVAAKYLVGRNIIDITIPLYVYSMEKQNTRVTYIDDIFFNRISKTLGNGSLLLTVLNTDTQKYSHFLFNKHHFENKKTHFISSLLMNENETVTKDVDNIDSIEDELNAHFND